MSIASGAGPALVIVGVATLVALVALVLALPQHRIESRSAYYRRWLEDDKPFLVSAMNVESATVKMEVVAKGSEHGPLAPVFTYFVPSSQNECLLAAQFRLRIDEKYAPIGIEESDYRCVDLKGTSVVERDGRKWRRYYGNLLEEGSFTRGISELLANGFPGDVATHLATGEKELVGEWDVEHDIYSQYGHENAANSGQPQSPPSADQPGG
jgi:hypothetical protein